MTENPDAHTADADSLMHGKEGVSRRVALGTMTLLASVPASAAPTPEASPYDLWLRRPGNAGKSFDMFLTSLEAKPVGASAAVAGTLAALKAAPIASGTMLWDGAPFRWEGGDASIRSDEGSGFVTAVTSDHQPGGGAWVRQRGDSIQVVQFGRGAIARSVQDEFRDLPVSPEGYGAVGDGVADDTAALQAALDSGRSVRLTQGRTYVLKSRLVLSASNVSVMGGGRVKIPRDFKPDRGSDGTHMRALFVKGENVTISGVIFDAADAPLGTAAENGLIWSTAPFTAIRDCQFIGNPKGTCIWSLGDAPYLSVLGCQFLDCSGAVFAKGRNVVINNNIIINATDAAIAINGTTCVGAVVANNTISNEKLAPVPSMIAVEEGPSDWTITGNTLLGANGGGIVCINILDFGSVKGGIIANNVINGCNFAGKLPTSRNPAALLSISQNYVDWIVHDNRISGCPAGNSNSRLAILPATGGSFHDNVIDGTATPGLSAMVSISAGSGGLSIKDNRTIGPKGARHFLFGEGAYGDAPCIFIGGKFHGGAEGINAELKAPSISGLQIGIQDLSDCTAGKVVHAPSAIGDRGAFLNAGAWARPHRIGIHTEMYCDALPAKAGALPFQGGDKFHYLNPQSGGYLGIVRVANAWKHFGAIS